MPASRSVDPTPTHTSVILAALVAADDMITAAHIQSTTGLRNDIVFTTLKHLRRHCAVDSIEEGGTLYWFATPATDTRKYALGELRHEDEPRRNNLKQVMRPSRTAKPRNNQSKG